MPMPHDVTIETPQKQTPLSASFNVSLASNSIDSERLQRTIRRLVDRYYRQTGFAQVHSDANTVFELILSAEQRSPETAHLQVDESYSLVVRDSVAKLTAKTDIGIIRGAETFLQLIKRNQDGFVIPHVEIHDAPSYSWRGVMIDSARHFVSIDSLFRLLDGMASAKLNVLHWHLADDQGWRLPIDGYPNLHQLASDGQYYTHQQVTALVAHANSLGIRVVPELDFPGHASAIALAYPELVAGEALKQIERRWGVHSSVLDPTSHDVYRFIKASIKQLTELFPDEYVHIGGDEVEPTDWLKSSAIQRFMKQNDLDDAEALQAYFNQRLSKLLASHQRKMIGWDEVFHPDLPVDTVVQSWRGHDSVTEVANSGRPVILSTGFYVDQPQYSYFHYQNSIEPPAVPNFPDLVTFEHKFKFTIHRLRGSAVTGYIAFGQQSGNWAGSVDFDQRSRNLLNVERVTRDMYLLRTHSWMGPVEFRIELVGDSPRGYTVIGNAQLATELEAVDHVPTPYIRQPLDAQARKNILGAEATLWSENVTDYLVDVKLWPRLYAIAEQMWGSADTTDLVGLYNRLRYVSQWAELSVGLQHNAQLRSAVLRATGFIEADRIMPLVELLEPAHYYHRHHLKSVAGNYHQLEPLNQLVDALPVESESVIEFNQRLTAWLVDRDSQDVKMLFKQLEDWGHRISRAASINNSKLKPIVTMLGQQHAYLTELLNCVANDLLCSDVVSAFKSQRLREPMQEMIGALSQPIEELYFYLLAKADSAEHSH